MHKQAYKFVEHVAAVYGPQYFKGKVIDIGSIDINGTIKPFFPDCDYVGVDIEKGENVDIAVPCHLLPETLHGFYDVVASTEAFEHDMHLSLTLEKCVKLLKPGGLFFFTCANQNRAEHGTESKSPSDSLTSNPENPWVKKWPTWKDYYKGVSTSDLVSLLKPDDHFQYYEVYINTSPQDLYFVGVKKNPDSSELLTIPTPYSGAKLMIRKNQIGEE